MKPESPGCCEQVLSASKALPLTLFLICSSSVFAESFSHDETADRTTTDTPYQMSIADPSPGYQHGVWWITAIGAGSVAALASSSIDQDQRQHYGISMVLGAASEFGLRRLDIASNNRWGRIALATGIGLVPGLVKEATDDTFDSEDMLANTLGSFAGALLSDLIQGPAGSHYAITAGKDQMTLVASYSF